MSGDVDWCKIRVGRICTDFRCPYRVCASCDCIQIVPKVNEDEESDNIRTKKFTEFYTKKTDFGYVGIFQRQPRDDSRLIIEIKPGVENKEELAKSIVRLLHNGSLKVGNKED